ncbi:hypothetical protein L211DRAFT_767628, partial [Terfezia boudieri ATCC MYA-4762]
GPLPTFNPTSSQDLDSLLARFRKQMFTEPHLLERQRLLTQKKKNHHFLEEDPIYFPIGNQTVQLTPKLVHHNFPRKMFTKAVHLMKVPSDFDAIPELVLGYTQSGSKLLDKNICMAVRRAGITGRADVLIKILEQAEHNKIHIPMSIAREGFRGFIVTAKLPSKHAVIKAVRGARQLRNLLGKQDTLGLDPEPVKIAKDPVGLGTLAGITSEASRKFNGGLDHGGYTAWYVKKMFLPESWDSVKDEQ